MRKLILLTAFITSFFSHANAQQLQWLDVFTADSSCHSSLYASCIVNDKFGNVITAGVFSCLSDMDPSSGLSTLTAVGEDDYFIQKVSSSEGFIWAKAIGGAGSYVKISGITTDNAGNVYATGSYTGSIDFDPGPLTHILTSSGLLYSTFVLKLDAAGAFVWVKNIHGYGVYSVMANCIEVDPANHIYVGGYFSGLVNFNTSGGTDTLRSGYTASAGFMLKLDAAGNYIWCRKNDGSHLEVSSIVCDDTTNVYYTGSFEGTVTLNRITDTITLITDNSNLQGFVAKMDNNGMHVWAKQFTSVVWGSTAQPQRIRIDRAHRLIVEGGYSGTVNFNTNPSIPNVLPYSSVWSCFTERIDADGNFLWAKAIGGPPQYYGDIGVDSMCNVFSTGSYMSLTDFDPGAGTFMLPSPPTNSTIAIYLQKLDSLGNFIIAFPIMGEGNVAVSAISVADAPYIYLAGAFNDTTNFNPQGWVLACPPLGSGRSDGFTAKYAVTQFDGVSTHNKPQMNIYPNPSSGIVNIRCSTLIEKVQVTDITGRVVYNAAPGNMVENLSIEQPGMYFVTVITSGQALTSKVLVTQ